MKKESRKRRAVRMLKEAAEQMGNQSELARIIGVSQASVSTWLSGEYAPNAESIQLIEDALMKSEPKEAKQDDLRETEMIRNIDVDAIRTRCDQIGITRKQLCDRLGKSDNYFHNLSENGCTGEVLTNIAEVLWSKPDGFIKGGKPLYDDDLEVNDVAVKTELHKIRSKVGALCTLMTATEKTTKELDSKINATNKLLACVISELYLQLGMVIDGREETN